MLLAIRLLLLLPLLLDFPQLPGRVQTMAATTAAITMMRIMMIQKQIQRFFLAFWPKLLPCWCVPNRPTCLSRLCSLFLNNIQGVVLLVDKNAHLIEELCKFGDGALDPFDVFVTFLHLTQSTSCFTVTVAVQKGLREDLTVLIIVKSSLNLLLSGIGLDDTELTLSPCAVLLAIRLLHLLVALNRLLETVLHGANLGVANVLVTSSGNTLCLGLQQFDAVLDTVGQRGSLLLDRSKLLFGVLSGSFIHVVERTRVKVGDLVDVLVDETDGVLDSEISLKNEFMSPAGFSDVTLCISKASAGEQQQHLQLQRSRWAGLEASDHNQFVAERMQLEVDRCILLDRTRMLLLAVADHMPEVAVVQRSTLWNSLLLCRIRVITVAIVSSSVSSVAPACCAYRLLIAYNKSREGSQYIMRFQYNAELKVCVRRNVYSPSWRRDDHEPS